MDFPFASDNVRAHSESTDFRPCSYVNDDSHNSEGGTADNFWQLPYDVGSLCIFLQLENDLPKS